MLLASARSERGVTLDELAARSRYSVDQLAALEHGSGPLLDTSIDTVLAVYGVAMEDLVPARRQVVLDLTDGKLLVAEESVALPGAPTADEVLGAYLSLVYALRKAEPGTPLVLRGFDVAVLANALHLAEPDVQGRLGELMREPTPEVRRLTGVFRKKVLVPVVGVVLVATAVGTVLVLRSDDRPAPTPAPTGVQRVDDVPDPSLIPPAVEERAPDGSPSSVAPAS